MRIGFIGLGLMGSPMATRLLAAGHDLTVTSRRRESAAGLEQRGARWSATPVGCADGRELVILMLPDVATVERVALGPDGVIAAPQAPQILIDMSTTAPELAERLAAGFTKLGSAALDAPVSGGPAGAEAGTLSIMVGGDASAFESVEPVLAALGRPWHVGPAGAGQRTKLVNQLLIAGAASGIAEAWALSERLGLDPALTHSVASAGIATSPLLSFFWSRLVAGDLSPGFRIDQMIKDLGLALSEARQQGLDLPASRATMARYRGLSEQGKGDYGTQALAKHESLYPNPDRDERA